MQIEDNILETVPNLKDFTLHFSNISNVSNIKFTSVQNLTYLEMEEVPLNEYSNLQQLTSLMIFNNNIKRLGANAFKGAANL